MSFTKDELGKMADQCHRFYMLAQETEDEHGEMNEVSLPAQFVKALCNNFCFMYKELYGEEKQ